MMESAAVMTVMASGTTMESAAAMCAMARGATMESSAAMEMAAAMAVMASGTTTENMWSSRNHRRFYGNHIERGHGYELGKHGGIDQQQFKISNNIKLE